MADGRFLHRREEELFDGERFWHFLFDIHSTGRRRGKPVLAISDNARYHHARLHKDWRNSVLPDFDLHFLPPYSPELNPIERVWKQTRRNCLHNRYFGELVEVVDVVEAQFDQWRRPNTVLRRLCSLV